MSTSDLIERLVTDLRPVARGAALRRIVVGAIVGVALSAVMMLAILGGQPHFLAAILSEPYWLKAGYTLLLAALGASAVIRLSRPAGEGGVPGLVAAVTVAVVVGLALDQLAAAPAALRSGLLLGTSALVCPWLIALLAAPVLGGLFWAMRGLAPTRLRAAGLAAGLTSGAAGAWVYAFHCPESALPFIALWYTAGIVVPGVAGWALGPRLLRW